MTIDEAMQYQLHITLPAFFAACAEYVKSLIVDRWIWGHGSTGDPCVISRTLKEDATQEEKDEIVATIFIENEHVVICNEWVQMDHSLKTGDKEFYRPVNVLVQTWEKA